MKTIKLIKNLELVTYNGNQVETEIKTIDLLKIALNTPVQGGYSINEISIRIKILDNIEKAEKANSTELQIEDADYESLKRIVKETKWNVISRTILNFVNDFDKN